MRAGCVLLILLILAHVVAAQRRSGDAYLIDVGAPGDDAYVGEGMYHREGPYGKDRHGSFHAQPFRWTRNDFGMTIPVFPGKDNVVLMHMKMTGGPGQGVMVESEGRPITVLEDAGSEQYNYEFVVPASVVGGRKKIPLTFRAAVPRKRSAGSKEKRVLFCAVAKLSISPRGPAVGKGEKPTSGVSVMPLGGSLYVTNGKLALWCGQPAECIASISVGTKRAARLKGAVVQFEKAGVGYKGTGIGWAWGRVKGVAVESKEPSRVVVAVTVERTRSSEAERCFEAVYELVVVERRPCFEIRLVQIKNTDTVPYEVRGYSHKVQPPQKAEAKPLVFRDVAVWIMKSVTCGAVARADGDFEMGFRFDAEGRAQGEVTRRIGCSLKAGEMWKGGEPSLIIFVTTADKKEAVYREALRLRQ